MNPWRLTTSQSREALDVVDGAGLFFHQYGPHYSRLTPGSAKLTGPGREIVLITRCGRAVWSVTLQRPPKGAGLVWRNSVFCNRGAGLSSDLVRWATLSTFAEWARKYSEMPSTPLRTEINTRETGSANPGYCYKLAGWRRIDGPASAKVRRPFMVYLVAPTADEISASASPPGRSRSSR